MELLTTVHDDLPHVDLRPARRGDQGRLSDPVDPEAARLISELNARRHGILPFAMTPYAVQVAVSHPIEGEGAKVLEQLDRPVQLFRASHAQTRAAQKRVWSPPGTNDMAWRPERHDRQRLGEILVAEGAVTAGEVHGALERQVADGGRLGAILVNANRTTSLTVARAVAQQHHLPLIELQNGEDGQQSLWTLDPWLFHLMPEGFWHDHSLVPLELADDHLTVAMVDPSDEGVLNRLRDATRWHIHPVVTGRRDIVAALRHIYDKDFTEDSRSGLLRMRPDDSASFTLTKAQRGWGLLLGLLAVVGLAAWPLVTLIALNTVVELFYLGLAGLKLGLLAHLGRGSREGRDIHVPLADIVAIDTSTLPTYTVLVPAYREAPVLSILARALSELDYPHDRLDVKLLLEEDDADGVAAARSLNLPNFIEVVVMPPAQPRTKPKACNYGLRLARGEYTVIFDAEDIPEPDQLLKAVAAFRAAAPNVACVQAKLAYFNRNQNLLTRWFTAEYLMWFDLLLPALHAARLPIPLGGTSNHFRTSVLRELGAWDPYNVAEDADLGIRLHKAGYRTAVIDATTYEEANSDLNNWIRQRSRWVKGYMQTWLVHMRHPIALWRSLGTRGFLGFHALIGGTWLTLLLNPVYALLTTLWYATHLGVLQSPFPSWVYWVAIVNLVVGTFAFTYTNMVAVGRRNLWDLMVWTAFSPVYWALMSIAAWKGFVQLITRPSYWEKTNHGLTSAPTFHGLPDRSMVS